MTKEEIEAISDKAKSVIVPLDVNAFLTQIEAKALEWKSKLNTKEI